MAAFGAQADVAERLRIFRAAAPYFGKVLPAAFFQNSQESLPGVARLHNLASGIFKPKDSIYALCITSMLSSPYNQVYHNPDRTWWMHYSPKSGGMEQAANVALIRCMSDRQPILVARQVSDKFHRDGSRSFFSGSVLLSTLTPRLTCSASAAWSGWKCASRSVSA